MTVVEEETRVVVVVTDLRKTGTIKDRQEVGTIGIGGGTRGIRAIGVGGILLGIRTGARVLAVLSYMKAVSQQK